MELNNISVGGFDIQSPSKFETDTSEVSIVRIFELNGTNYVSFADHSDKVLHTLSVDKFRDKFESFLGSLSVPTITPNADGSDCECVNCK